MKKLITAVTIISILTATGAQIANGLIDRLLNFSVKDLIVERVFDEFWKSAKRYGMEEDGHGLYYSARDVSYENLGITHGDWETYLQGRTIVVARIKGYFFNGEKLKDTYLAIQPRFKEEFSKLSDEEKGRLRKTLVNTKTCFEIMLKKEHQEAYSIWLDGSSLSARELSEIWLTNSLSAEDISKRIKAGELKSTPDRWEIERQAFKDYPDKDIAKFAGRRLKDGGEPLIRLYLEVIDLALADVR